MPGDHRATQNPAYECATGMAIQTCRQVTRLMVDRGGEPGTRHFRVTCPEPDPQGPWGTIASELERSKQ
jgi:hypothetical protein